VCCEIAHVGDSDIGIHRGKPFDFASREVVRGSGLSMLEDRWQRSDHFTYRGFVILEVEDQALVVTKSQVARSRCDLGH
jgi:hypothetical protein